MMQYEGAVQYVETLVRQLEKFASDGTGDLLLVARISGGIDAVVQVLEISNNWKKRIDAALLKIQGGAAAPAPAPTSADAKLFT